MLLAILFASIVAGLMLFAGIILAGQRLVRLLGLAPELPEGPSYEVPPPPAVIEPAGATERRAHRGRIHALGQAAYACLGSRCECDAYVAAAEALTLHPEAAPIAEQALPGLRTAAASARMANEAADAAWNGLRQAVASGQDSLENLTDAARDIAAQTLVATTATAQARALAEPLPDPADARQRRLMIMLIIALVLCLGCVAIMAQRWNQPL